MKHETSALRAYTPEEIAGWIARYRGSGLSLGAFARQHGLSRSRLHYWVYDKRYAHLGKTSAAPVVFQELRLTTPLPLTPWAVEISLPAGLVVRFSATATPAWMRAVVEALHRPC